MCRSEDFQLQNQRIRDMGLMESARAGRKQTATTANVSRRRYLDVISRQTAVHQLATLAERPGRLNPALVRPAPFRPEARDSLHESMFR